jgi:ABC-2 type transport system ATP-binding protein
MPAEGAIAVSVSGLVRRFGDFVAVNGISFQVPAGEIFGFLGPNGAGKSTTIRMLCGILAPTAGGGTVAGLDIATQPERIKTVIGYMSQRFSLYDDLTVEENIDFYSGIYRIPPQRARQRKDWALEMAELSAHRAARTASLPAGWKQRLALGCAILHEPAVVFLDEPTSGVDPLSRRRFWDLIYELAAGGVTVFVTTHYMDEAEYCDRAALIYRGDLIALGSPAELKTTHMPHDVLEVAVDRPLEAMEIIRRVDGVSDAALFGTHIHAVARQGMPPQAVAEALRAAGFGAAMVRQIEPSLEDVFVSLIEEHDRASTAGGAP